MSLCPRQAVPSVPNKASQLDPVLFVGEHCGGTGGRGCDDFGKTGGGQGWELGPGGAGGEEEEGEQEEEECWRNVKMQSLN